MHNASPSSAPIQYRRERIASKIVAGKRSGITKTQLERAFMEATARGSDTITVAAEELGIYYTITKANPDYIVTVYYTASCPTCQIHIDWNSFCQFNEITLIKHSITDFSERIESVLRNRHGIPAYVDCQTKPNDRGMSIFVIGADSGTLSPLMQSLKAALAQLSTKLEIRVIDGRENG